MPALAPHYQLQVSRDGHLDKLDVLGEMRDASMSADAVTALCRDLEHRIKTFVGVSTRVTLAQPEGIERTMTGKARRVIDKRPKT